MEEIGVQSLRNRQTCQVTNVKGQLKMRKTIEKCPKNGNGAHRLVSNSNFYNYFFSWSWN